jgi:diguanylate cyclase (GGDEF)-like protein
MFQIASCIAFDHDPWMLLLSVVICAAGAFSIVHMFERAALVGGIQRYGWAFLTSVAGGATIWCTHFVAMLAYQTKVPVHLDPVMTMASLVAAIVGSFLGFMLAASRPTPAFAVAGGTVFGAAISAMHFMGMAAYRVDGIIHWDMEYVVAAIVCAMAFGSAAFAVQRQRHGSRLRLPLATALVVIAIASLHFTAMTALHIVPLRLSGYSMPIEHVRALALATALVGMIVISAGVFAALIDRATRTDAVRKLEKMALSDGLTKLPNRVAFQAELTRQLGIADATGTKVGVCAIDLDRFKEINDIHGHKAGDDVLSALAERFTAAIGSYDMVARLGGDEFVAIIRFAEAEELSVFANKIDAAVKQPLNIGPFSAHLGASIGVAVYPDDASDDETLCNNADLAMFRAKCENAAVPRYYDAKLDEAIRARRELAVDLRRAIDDNQLDVHYQVQTSVSTRSVTGYEALLRWTHPVHGSIAPMVFIPIAEENGLILSLGEWVLRRACSDAASWPHKSRVAINVSPLQLAYGDLPRLIHQVLLDTGLPPSRLEIELTESAILADRDRALHLLRQIKALGIGIALDDFGTGYSSLETLRAFPFDKIKLDRLFASELETSPQATAIIRAVLALGKSLSIPVLAEGIETVEQLDVLIREGCDEAQGFFLGRPGPMFDEHELPVIDPRPTPWDRSGDAEIAA